MRPKKKKHVEEEQKKVSKLNYGYLSNRNKNSLIHETDRNEVL